MKKLKEIYNKICIALKRQYIFRLAVSLRSKIREYLTKRRMKKLFKRMNELSDLLLERDKYVDSIYHQIENESKILKDAAFSLFKRYLLNENFDPVINENSVSYSDDKIELSLFENTNRQLKFKTNNPQNVEVLIDFKTLKNLEDKFSPNIGDFDTIDEKIKALNSEIKELKIIFKDRVSSINTSYVCTMTPCKKNLYGESKPITHKSRDFNTVIEFILNNIKEEQK